MYIHISVHNYFYIYIYTYKYTYIYIYYYYYCYFISVYNVLGNFGCAADFVTFCTVPAPNGPCHKKGQRTCNSRVIFRPAATPSRHRVVNSIGNFAKTVAPFASPT